MSVKVLGSKHEANRGQYTFRWVIGKTTGDGEQASIEVIANAAELPSMVSLAYNLVDTRMLQQNQRYQDFVGLSAELPVDVRLKLNQCVDVAFGRATVDQLKRVRQDAEEIKSDQKSQEPSNGGENQ